MSSSPIAARRPGRPALFDRQRALDELLKLFWHKGYDAATQEEMLAATGLSSSTLYRSFGNKADILELVLRHYVDVASAMFAPLEHGDRGTADVLAFLTLLEEWLRGPMGSAGCLVVETMQDPINRDPRINALTKQHLDRMGRGLQDAVRRAIDAGELPRSTPGTFADALQAGVLGVLARARADDVADAVRLLNGVRALLPEAPGS
jgi:TetR/AcrR family transcriptional regulator, transcriptional repressor for nem operon